MTHTTHLRASIKGLTQEKVDALWKTLQGVVANEDRPVEKQTFTHESLSLPYSWAYSNSIGQGCEALIDLTYNLLQDVGPYEYWDKETDGEFPDYLPDDGTQKTERYNLIATCDTPYGAGMKVHASFVIAAGMFLGPENIWWDNEMSGEWFDASTAVDWADQIVKDGAKAKDWFENTVMPAIKSGSI